MLFHPIYHDPLSQVGWDYRIPWLLNECPGYDIKPFDGEAPCPLTIGEATSDCVQSMGQIEVFDILTVCKQMTEIKSNC